MKNKIVKIVDEYLVVVDYGLVQNAREGDILEIYQVGERVYDNKDNFLGTLDLRKGKLRVINVYENMSLCQSNEYTRSLQQDVSLLVRAFNRSELLALNVDTEQISGGYSRDNELIIRLGDPVKVIESQYRDEILQKEVEEEDE